MTPLHYSFMLVFLSLGAVAAGLVALVKASRIRAAAQANLDDAKAQIEQAQQIAEETDGHLVEAKKLLDSERDRGDRYFRCIETVERERNQWQDAYSASAAGHANAQQMMLNELGRLSKRMLRAKDALEREPGGDVPPGTEDKRRTDALKLLDTRMDPRLQAIHDSFAAEHDPETGIGAQIERPEHDLTEGEAAQRKSAH
jgi:chromosome segregation ATPase